MPDASEVLRQTNFGTVDWVIVIVYPLVSLGIGLYVRRFVTNMQDFVVAGRGLGVCLGIATITGTELGLITVMYSAQKGFVGGFAAFHIALAAGVVTFIVGATGLFVYRLREMGVMTIPEFYERRFDRKTRVLGGVMMAFGGILNMGLFLQVGAKFVVGITGMSAAELATGADFATGADVAAAVNVATSSTAAAGIAGLMTADAALMAVMVFLISLVLVYTCLGGMVSVVIADYVQFVVLSFGLLLATGAGGLPPRLDEYLRHRRAADGPRRLRPHRRRKRIRLRIHRLDGVSRPRRLRHLAHLGGPRTGDGQRPGRSPPIHVRLGLLPDSFFDSVLLGHLCVCVRRPARRTQSAVFPAGVSAAPATAPRQPRRLDNLYAMPLFLGRILPAGVVGVITAGMVAAFMSTHDSYLLCWSSVITQDVVAPLAESLGRPLGARGDSR